MARMETLAALGAAIQLLGIVSIAAPDLVPWLLRFAAWVEPRWRRVVIRVRRALHLRVNASAVGVTAAAEASTAASLSLKKIVNPNATLDEKIAFLIQRDLEAQRDVSGLAARVGAIESQTPQQLDALREEMKAHVSAERAASDAAHRTARVMGAVALTVGLGLSTAAVFVG